MISCSGSAAWRFAAGSENSPSRGGVPLEIVVPSLAADPALLYSDAAVCSGRYRREVAALVDDRASRIIWYWLFWDFQQQSPKGHCYTNQA